MSAQNELTPSLQDQRSIASSSVTDFGLKLEQNSFHAIKNPKGIIDLGSTANELMLDDLSGWTKKNVKKSQLRETLGYEHRQGPASVTKAAAEFINEHFRVRLPLADDNVLAANDTYILLDILIHNLADEGDTILIPTPSSGISSHDAWAKNAVHVVEVPCNDIPEERLWGPPPPEDAPIQIPELVKRLEAAVEVELSQKRKVRAIFLANPNNPLGPCYAAHVLLQVSQLCVKHEIHLIVDETYAMSAGDRFSSILSLDLNMGVTTVHVLWGMSKDLGFGSLGAAFLATYNRRIYDVMRSSSDSSWVSSSSATVAAKLLSDSKYIRNHYLPALRRRLNKRRKSLEEALDGYDIPYDKSEAGFFVSVDLSKWLELSPPKHDKESTMAFLEYMMEQRVFLEPSETFCSKQPGWYRLGFGGEKETFKLGLQRLLHCLRRLDGKPYTEPFALPTELYFPPSKGMAHFSMT
ncbi:aminotransferase class I and II [Colletotrichum sublineola]|nr:aminotransferase class I and II [Colletotrichum sublineola]